MKISGTGKKRTNTMRQRVHDAPLVSLAEFQGKETYQKTLLILKIRKEKILMQENMKCMY